MSWDTQDGVYLMSASFGSGSMIGTELVKKDGSVEDGFSLKYNTRYHISYIKQKKIILIVNSPNL